jgi:hypothetical protein
MGLLLHAHHDELIAGQFLHRLPPQLLTRCSAHIAGGLMRRIPHHCRGSITEGAWLGTENQRAAILSGERAALAWPLDWLDCSRGRTVMSLKRRASVPSFHILSVGVEPAEFEPSETHCDHPKPRIHFNPHTEAFLRGKRQWGKRQSLRVSFKTGMQDGPSGKNIR